MSLPIILAHGEGLITSMAIWFLAGVFAVACLAGALMHHFSKDPSDKKDVPFFLIAAGICVVIILFAPAIAHLFRGP